MPRTTELFVDRPSFWIAQATSDLGVFEQLAGVEGSASQRWYLLQQAYEKAIKSIGIIVFSPSIPDSTLCRGFKHFFLATHRPLTAIASLNLAALQKQFKREASHVYRALVSFSNQMDAIVGEVHGAEVLRRLDAVHQSFSAEEKSFRYPFFADPPDGSPIAPCEYTDWGVDVGTEKRVHGAVKNVLKTARREAKALVRS